MNYSFQEINDLYQEINLLIQETINNVMLTGLTTLFSIWLLGGGGIGIFLYSSGDIIVGTFLGIWIIGFIIILIPGLFEFLIQYFFRKSILTKHYKIISELQEKIYEINFIEEIPYILYTSKRLYKLIRRNGLFFYIIYNFCFFLEKRGVIARLSMNYTDTKNIKGIIASEASAIIRTKKTYLLSLIKRMKILEVEIMNYILTDLRSDLVIRLTEQQSILQSAKSEVEENIQGTTELDQISELQRIRLDKQIEQFEELQKVLVRV